MCVCYRRNIFVQPPPPFCFCSWATFQFKLKSRTKFLNLRLKLSTYLILATCLQGADLNQRNKFGAGALTLAAASGHLSTVRLLLESGLKPETAPEYRQINKIELRTIIPWNISVNVFRS